MSPAHVLEPTYHSLKRKLLEGAWPPGERLEALRLADEFGVSMTPVRDCLNRLVGERLVDMKPGNGYRVPYLGEQTLREMVDANAVLLGAALSSQARGMRPTHSEDTDLDHAGRTARLFEAIAMRAGNRVLTEMVRDLGDRMHAIRNLDLHVFPDASIEIAEMAELAMREDSRLASRLEAYHERRRRNASVLIQLLR